MKGILLNRGFDLVVEVKRGSDGKIISGLLIGDQSDQIAAMVMTMSQGECKEDPLLGVGITRFVRSRVNAMAFENILRLHLSRAGLDWEDYKDKLTYKTTVD
jgi:hypothetical protein